MFFSFFKMGRNIGIDLGTVNTLISTADGGIVVREPSVVAIDKNDGRVLAVGTDANEMLGRTPENIIAIRPMKDGVIADFDVTREMIKLLIMKARGKKLNLIKPNVIVCVPTGITKVEKKAVEDACIAAGAKKAVIMEEAMAAAVGAGVDISKPKGHMIVDIGGGTTEVAVVSLSGIVVSKSLRLAGNEIDNAITAYIRRAYNMTIGKRTAEEIKIAIGSAMSTEEENYEIKGRDMLSGLPKTMNVTSSEIREAMTEPLREIISAITFTLENTPPELAGDILENGIILTGGGALIKNIDKMINAVTGLPVKVADNPLDCTALGSIGAGCDEKALKRSFTAEQNQ